MRILLMIDNTVLKEYIIDQNEIIIGRDSNSDICIDNITVSRKHARIAKGPDDYLVEDMGSVNGTFVNGHWVSKKLLDTGDEVSIGKYSLVIYFEDDPATAAATTAATAKIRPIDDGCNTYRMELTDFEKILKKHSK
jgi:pSer/pThr/pTyr-binding forkhead associated (FHA) protein